MKTPTLRRSVRRFKQYPTVSAMLLATPLLLAGTGTQAIPISTDLTIIGNVELSTTIGVSPFSDGNVSQNGQVRVMEGGAVTQNGFSTTAGTADGIDDGTTTLPSPNPQLGSFTQTGDGLGYTTDLDAAFATGFAFNEGYDFVIDFGMDLDNASLVDTYTVTIRVDFSNIVSASGTDAYAEAGLDLEVDNVDILTSDVLSDTLLGDVLNGVVQGTNGATIMDVGTSFFDVILAPGAARQIGGNHQWEGGVFEPGTSFADIVVDISIDSVSCSGPTDCTQTPPNPIPTPTPLALLALGLAGMRLARRPRS